MAIKVAGNVVRRLLSRRASVTLQVQGASDQAAAAQALERARGDIWDLDGGWESAPGLSPGDANGPQRVGSVVRPRSGPVIWMDLGETPDALVATIPDLIVKR